MFMKTNMVTMRLETESLLCIEDSALRAKKLQQQKKNNL